MVSELGEDGPGQVLGSLRAAPGHLSPPPTLATLCIHVPHPPPPLPLNHCEKPCVTAEKVKIYVQPKNNEGRLHSAINTLTGAEPLLQSRFLLPGERGPGVWQVERGTREGKKEQE